MNQELLWFLLAAISQLWNRDGNKDFDWYPKIHIELDKGTVFSYHPFLVDTLREVEREHTQRDPDDKDFNACALNEMYDTFRPEMYNDHEMTRVYRILWLSCEIYRSLRYAEQFRVEPVLVVRTMPPRLMK